MFKKVAIFGVGLIGGSIGAGLKARKMAQEVVGGGRRLESLKKAAAIGAIDSYTIDPGEGFAKADLIILSAPINAVLGLMKTGLPFLGSKRSLITDACSTKAAVLKVAEQCLGCFQNRGLGAAGVGNQRMLTSQKRKAGL